MSNKVTLNRSLSLTQMVLYGLGTTIGAGIYALIGELAGMAGFYAPISFLVAAIIASLTALSFAELSSRFPQAAGTAIYVKAGFHSVHFSTLTGALVCLAGIVSAAALLNGFVGYLSVFIDLPSALVIVLITLALSTVLIRGIQSSANVAALFTLIEVGGLVLIISVSQESLNQLPERLPELIPPFDFTVWQGIFAGSVLAFYAFIGFEDMVVVAEEVKDVRRNLPRAIMLTLFITTLLYLTVMIIAVLAMPPQQLQASDAPLNDLFQHFTGQNTSIISVIALLALVNGVLIQMIMASRVIYGLSSKQQLPALFSDVSPCTHTPVNASVLVIVMVLTLALVGHLSGLAQLTSFIMLLVFSLVNLALCRIKLTESKVADGILTIPFWIPAIGFISSSVFAFLSLVELFF